MTLSPFLSHKPFREIHQSVDCAGIPGIVPGIINAFYIQARVRVYLLRSRLSRYRANQSIPRHPKKTTVKVIKAVVFISVLKACQPDYGKSDYYRGHSQYQLVRVEDTCNKACGGYDNTHLPYGSGEMVKILSYFVQVQYRAIPEPPRESRRPVSLSHSVFYQSLSLICVLTHIENSGSSIIQSPDHRSTMPKPVSRLSADCTLSIDGGSIPSD